MTASTPSRAALAAAGSQTSPLISSKKRFEQHGKQAVAAELEAVEDSDTVSLLQKHRDQCRADITGSAGDEYSHRGLHPWWLETRLERRGCVGLNRCGKARRAVSTRQALVLAAFSVVLLGATGDLPLLRLAFMRTHLESSCPGDTIAKSSWLSTSLLARRRFPVSWIVIGLESR